MKKCVRLRCIEPFIAEIYKCRGSANAAQCLVRLAVVWVGSRRAITRLVSIVLGNATLDNNNSLGRRSDATEAAPA